MLKSQIDQYDMLLAVENHFDDNETLWSVNEPISAAKTLFSDKIDELSDVVAIQLIDPTGVTANKADLRNELESKGFILSAALSGYAATHPGKKDMYKRVHFTKSNFYKFRETELMGVITNLHREALTELENLENYGVTLATLTDIKETNDAFGTIKEDPTAAISKRKDATERIAVLLPEAIGLLNTQMDNLIVGLSATQPQFVSIYSNVRAINNTGSSTLSLTITTLDARNNEPVANANLEIIDQGITRVSGKRGYNKVQNLVQGSYELRVSHPNFAQQTIPFTIVNGETTELVVSLESVLQNIPL